MNNRNVLKILSIILMLIVIIQSFDVLFADTMETIFDYKDVPGKDSSITKIDDSVKKVWGTVVLVLQVASVAAFVFAGVRYMFASAEAKANIKNSMMFLILGSIIVFASSTVVGFIVQSAKEVLD